jgi:1,4-alpha-glucan branching enzyme
VVYGKKALISKMPGDKWQQFANLRLLLGWMWTHPGKKLLFMGGEFGQWREWHHEGQLDWWLTHEPGHAGMQRWMKDLNHAYRDNAALHQQDFSAQGFQWIDGNDYDNSVLTFLRWPEDGPPILVAANFTPIVREGYRVGVPLGGRWQEILNGDAPVYGGSGQGNMGGVEAQEFPWHGRSHSVCLRLPPLAIVVFKPESAE